MNKDYKLMALLIPIILVLSIVLYISPDASGLTTNIATPLLNQTDNSSLNQSSTNSSPVATQINPIANQSSQGTSVNNNNNYNSPANNYPTNNGNTSSNTDNTTTNSNPINPTNYSQSY